MERTPTEARVYSYRQPARRFAPRVWFWSVLGGLAMGLGTALILIVAGQMTYSDAAFRAVLAGGTLAGASLLYLVFYRLALYRMVLRVGFDPARQAISVRLMRTRETRWYAFEDVLTFRLVRHAEGWRRGCGLVMHTESAGPVELVLTDLPCYERTGLPHFVRRLTAELEIVHRTRRDYDLPPRPAVVGGVPPAADDTSQPRRLPDVHR